MIAWPAFAKIPVFLSFLALGTNPALVSLLGITPVEPSRPSSFLTAWDSGHYLSLCFDGYEAGESSCAFYPLWPMLLRLIYAVTGAQSHWIAFVAAVVLSSTSFMLFARLARNVIGESAAKKAVWIYAAFPGSLFFLTIYSEALFATLVLAMFLALEARRRLSVFLAGFLLPLARAVGIFAVIPLFWRIKDAKGASGWAAALSPLLGFACYLWLMFCWTGNPFEGFAVQRNFPAQPSVWRLLDPSAFVQSLLATGEFHEMMESSLDRVSFLILAVALPSVWKLRRDWFWWALAVGFVSAMSSSLMSFTRYLIVIFPVFMVMGQWLDSQKGRILFPYYIFIAFGVQIYLFIRFVNCEWAG